MDLLLLEKFKKYEKNRPTFRRIRRKSPKPNQQIYSLDLRSFNFLYHSWIYQPYSCASFLRTLFWLHQRCEYCCAFFFIIFYFTFSWRISLIILLIMLFMEHFAYVINVHFKENSWIIYLSIFVITWIFQFIGHKIEGKKPSFLKDLQFLLVGPIWLLHFILKKIGIPY